MRTLGVDYGDARIGLAITDALGITAQGLETIHHNANDKIALKRIEEIIKQYDIDTIVVGLPLNLSGQKTQRLQRPKKRGKLNLFTN